MSKTIRDLLAAGVHLGHATRFRNPAMNQYIFGVRNGMHIIDLDKTMPLFNNAMAFITEIIKRKGKIMLVGTKHAARALVLEHATATSMPYVNYRWLGGMLTNYRTIKQSIRRLKELEEIFADGTVENLTKKEGLMLSREKEKLCRNLDGIKNMVGLPDALFVIDVNNEKIAIQEAKRLKIPVIAIIDTNSNPADVDYPIPGNDDAMRAIALYLESISTAIDKGNAELAGNSVEEEFIAKEN